MMITLLVSMALANPPARPIEADPTRGATIAISCRGCHGEHGIAKQPMHPNLAGQKMKYLAWQLQNFRDGKRPSHIMQHMVEGFSDQDIFDVSAYYSELDQCSSELQ